MYVDADRRRPAAGSFQPIDLAASMLRLNASTELMSAWGAPLRPRNSPDAGLREGSALLPATTLPLLLQGPSINAAPT